MSEQTMAHPTVSIIVPLYNAEKYIAETIHGVEAQTFRDWELLLVDDCSPDQSAAVAQREIDDFDQRQRQKRKAEKAGEKTEKETEPEPDYPRILLIRKEKNEGAAMARNTGLSQAKGRFIAFLDADDLWDPRKLEKELAFQQQTGAGFIFTAYKFGDEKGVPTGKAVRVPSQLAYKKALTRTIIFTSTVLIDRTQIADDLIRMPMIGSEDTATWWQILKSGVIARGLDEQLVIYRRPEKSLSSNKGKAILRIWNLYRKVANLSVIESAFCLMGWAWHAVMRRLVRDDWRSRICGK